MLSMLSRADTATYLITMLFTMLVIGGVGYGLWVMPRWQYKEKSRTTKSASVTELRKAA